MTTEQNLKTYEVNFMTETLQHAFYIGCPDTVDANKFAHAVLHYYDMPAEWGKKLGVKDIVEIDFEDCLPEYLHMTLQGKKELAMSEEDQESHKAVRKIIQQIMADEFIPMAIYDQENKLMTIYSTKKQEVAPRAGASGNVLNFG